MKSRLLAVLTGLFCLSALSPAQAETVSLKVLSLNVWGLPAPIGKDLEPRMERIAESIQDYDIVALQETFDQRTEVLPRLSGFAYAYHHKNGGLYSQACGLMVLSRYPIVETDFMAFPKAVLPDSLASKGVLFVRLKHPQLGFVDVYDTHYQSRDEADAVKTRIESDNWTMQRLWLKHNRYYPTILVGDFNLLPQQSEYQDLGQRLPLIDTYDLARPQAAAGEQISHHTWPSWTSYTPHEDRIDYIFLLKNGLWNYRVSESRILFREPVRGYLLSDHLGVASTIEIEPSGPRIGNF